MKRKKPKLTLQTVSIHMQEWKIEQDILRIKCELIEKIKEHCGKHKISQRKLASMVPGLTQDRVSKIFSEKYGHMTIDKLVEISSTLGFVTTLRLS
jgi:predicted XRE-type DNA-binding protein